MDIKSLSEKEKGYILGLFNGDGYAYYNKKDRHYSVDFYLDSLKDKDVQERIVKLLKKIGLNVFLFKDKRFNCNRIRVHSKEFYKFCNLNNCGGGGFDIGFVSGLIDSNGYVNKKKSTIQIINTNKKLLKRCKQILEELNVKSSIKRKYPGNKDKKKSYFLSISVKFKNLTHFSIKAGRPALICSGVI